MISYISPVYLCFKVLFVHCCDICFVIVNLLLFVEIKALLGAYVDCCTIFDKNIISMSVLPASEFAKRMEIHSM